MKHQLTTTQLIALSTATLFAPIFVNVAPAKASFGDFMLGVGVAAGAGAIIRNNNRAAQERYRPVPPEQEYYRGVEDGTNGVRYDNPRNSPDYDRGYRVGSQRRR